MDMERNFATGYGHLLENPVLFLLFSSRAVEEFSMLLSRFGNLERCMVMQVYSDAASRINDAKIISMERDNPDYDALYRKQLASAIRRTKLRKFLRSKDFTVCAILENHDDYNKEITICEQVYNDLKSAYCNHVYFDFYIMVKEGFTSGVSLEISSHLNALRIVEEKDWSRYIFLVFDITNEECLIEKYSERFQAVLDSIVLTNCRSSTGISSAYINERLLEESSALGSKFLSLGRIKMTFDEAMVKNAIRNEMLGYVQHLPKWSDVRLKQLNLNGLRHDIQVSIEGIYSGIMQIASYKSTGREAITHYTNHEVISCYFQNSADYYMQFHQEKLETKFREYMMLYCQREIKSWLEDALYQYSIGILGEDCCQAIYQRAIEEIRKYREDIRQTSQDNEDEYVLWKNAKAKASHWRHWLLGNYQYEHYRVLRKWITFRGAILADVIIEQCLEDMEYYITKWVYRIEEHCKLFSLCCLKARERLEEMLDGCSNAEQHLIQSYRQKIARELEKMTVDIQHICDIINELLREDADVEYMNRSIWQCVDWLYTQRLRNIKLYSASEESIFDEILAKLQDHTYLFTRTQIPNIVPYIVLMGQFEDPLLNYAHQRKDARYIVYEAEYMEYPVAFYYQHIR